uniref:Uncharacterized protein n=1 Tax=Tetraselmis sp. GSL018 TaxID=582737 RepID=A0A061S7T2_9CHLO
MALPKRHRGTEADRNCKLRTLQNAPSWKRTLGCPCEQPRRRVLRNRAGPSAVLNKKTRTSLVLNASLKSSQNLDTQCVEIPVPDNSISRLDDSIHFLPLAPKPISCIPPTSDWSFRVARRHISIILKHFRRFYLQHLKPAKSRNARKQTRSEPESLYQPKSLTRRNVTAVTGSFLTAILVLPLESAAVHSGNRASLVGPPRELHIPLQYRDNVYCLLYTIDGKFFRGVVDTGSPFLTVSPDNCKEWGCWRGEGVATDLTDTWERYAAQEGRLQWRAGDVSFSGPDESLRHSLAGGRLAFGVFRSALPRGGRGDESIVGLVSRTAPGVRPSLLGQTRYRSFRLDLSGGLLSLSMSSLLTAGRPAIPIADMRRLGAPSQQYVARVRRLHINGRPVLTDRPVYAMLDSGSTGLFVTDTLFYEILMMIESWHSCRVELAARDGTCQALAASRSSPLFMCLPTLRSRGSARRRGTCWCSACASSRGEPSPWMSKRP